MTVVREITVAVIGRMRRNLRRAATAIVAAYAYDAQGSKSKTVGATTTIYVTNADNREVLEYSGTGALQTCYAFGLGPDEVLNQMSIAAGTRS